MRIRIRTEGEKADALVDVGALGSGDRSIISVATDLMLCAFGVGRTPARVAACACFAVLTVFPSIAEERPLSEIAFNRPSVTFAYPLSVQAGGRATVSFAGNYLDRVQRIRCECSDLRGAIRSATPLAVEATLEADATAPAGPRFLTLDTPKGPSNRILVRVTEWRSLPEREPNDDLGQAQSVPAPALIDGKIENVHDADMFRFRADEGERLAFNVLTGRNKAPGHVAAVLMTSAGRVLRRNLSTFGTDPYFDHTFAVADEYILAIVPRRFSDFYTILDDDTTINWQYQIAIGRSPILWSLFPLGGRRGTTVEAELRADFLEPAAVPRFSGSGLRASLEPVEDPCACLFRLTVDIAPDAPLGTRYLRFPDPSGTLMPLAFVVGDTPEWREIEPNDGLADGQPITLPAVLNGRIDRPGDRDGFRFTVNQFDEVAFQVDARGLGSHMTDPNLALVRPDGELTAMGDDRCRDCGQYFKVVRKPEMLDSKFWHYFQSGNPNDADAAGDYVLQLRDNSRTGGPRHAYRLTLRDKAPNFRVGAAADTVAGPLGGVARIPVAIRAEEGFTGGVSIRAEELPRGLRARPLVLRAEEPSGWLEIEHDADALPPEEDSGWVRANVRLTGVARIGDDDVLRRADLPPFYSEDGAGYNEPPRSEVLVVFVEPAAFAVSIERSFGAFRLDLAKDGKVEVPVTVSRPEGFEAALHLQGVEIPEGLRLETGPEENGVIRAILIGEADTVDRGAHRMAIRAVARVEGVETSEITRGFTVRIR